MSIPGPWSTDRAIVARWHRRRAVAALVSQDPDAVGAGGRRVGWSLLAGSALTGALWLLGALPVG